MLFVTSASDADKASYAFSVDCGVCKEGELIPQFEERTRNTPKSKANSCMASDITRDSPTSVGPARRPANTAETPSRLRSSGNVDTDTEDVQVLSVTYRETAPKEDGDMSGIVQQLSIIDLTGDD